ncbi:MAG: hypothetical protein IJ491_01350 [Clostridia bacterium]|nr:hypothetical protein [Clostridia bacterium]
MKKIISVLLAVIMAFSLCTVAFAEDAVTEDETTTAVAEEGTEEEAGDFDFLLDLPFWTIKGGAKIAKVALKLVIVFVKVGSIFGLVDTDDIVGQIMDLIESSQNAEEETTAAPETTVAPETTAAVAA